MLADIGRLDVTNNRDMQIKPVFLHFAPVLLSLFCGFISLSGYSVYYGFSENEPATWLSLIMLFWGLLLSMAALRDTRLEPAKRRAGLIFSFVYLAAILDERLKGHEAIGYYVQDHIDFLHYKLLNYTNDVLIVLAAVVGSSLLLYCLRPIADKRQYLNYFLFVAVAALVHGLLDISNHKHYFWQLFDPSVTYQSVHTMLETLGFFEESFKLWTEWFMILFLLRFFQNQAGNLRWQGQVFIGSQLMVSGLWLIPKAAEQIPYMIANPLLRYIRNYHFWIILAFICLAWAGIVWYRYRSDGEKRSSCGIFYVMPWYLVLPGITAVMGWMPGEKNDLSFLYWLVPAAFMTAGLIRRWKNRWLWGGLILCGVIGFSPTGVINQPGLLLQTGGLVFPLLIYYLWKEQKWLPVIFVVTGALVIQNPIWLVAGLGYAIFYWIDEIERLKIIRKTIITIQLALIILILIFGQFTWLANEHYDPDEKVMFQIGHQPVIPDN